MALIKHYVREGEGYRVDRYIQDPMSFVIEHIPDGTPFRIYIDGIGADNDVTEDFEALQDPEAVYHILEAPGGGIGKIISKIFAPIFKLILPSQKAQSASPLANSQADSPNNSLTDRNNKPRPYERSYDICGTVQTIPNDLMTTYKVFTAAGTVVEYGYYDAGRGLLQIKPEDIYDGDTRLLEISGSSVAIYAPYTSPNNTRIPQLFVGDDPITEGLYITVQSNEVDGQELRAINGVQANAVDMIPTLSGTRGIVQDPGGNAGFSSMFSVGDIAFFDEVRVRQDGDDLDISGHYPVLACSEGVLEVDVSSNLGAWQQIGGTEGIIGNEGRHQIGPNDPYPFTLTDWVTISRIPVSRIVVNIAAANGMYYEDQGGKKTRSVTVECMYQQVDEHGNPYGPIYTKQGTVTGRSTAYNGVTIYGDLPSPSRVRVRMRRVTPLDLSFEGTVVDEVTYINLYGQTPDFTPHYGDRTTVHSMRKQTPRAAEVRQPQLRMTATEMCFKYLGNGVFDSQATPNTQAVQSLIRLLRDPIVGNLSLTASNMDKLLETQREIEAYFGAPEAGQFCYTFDSAKTTAQDIISIIAEAIFCVPYRRGADVLLDFERPRSAPEMVFTHRSKTRDEKWTRTFTATETYDSVELSYIDPDTNVKETILLPAAGGSNTDKYDAKGVRNYKQAFWLAYRRYQKNRIRKVAVEFTATEEGVFARPGRPVSVVKGSRIAPQDGYVVAVNGMRVTLSQPVTFTPGDAHSLLLKKRDGSVQSVMVTPGSHDREVIMQSVPQEAIYTGNDALKTEFSFGSEKRHTAQMILVSTVDPGDDRTVKITGYNYSDEFYTYDHVQP